MAVKRRATKLQEYDAKRDFTRTPEPPPIVAANGAAQALSFCVQKHLASHLHYDFRLEHEGVLLSWAVPKGPSLNPADKRMAVHVEDHPLDYGSFEGVIPSGYGAGVVLLWDRGTWTPEPATPNVAAALAKGELKFQLDGVKLKGSWVLVRTRRQGPPRATGPAPEQWLLIKHRDAWAGEVDVAVDLPQSVKSFANLPDVLAAHDEPAEWRTTPPVKGGETGKLFADVLAGARKVRAGVAAPSPKPGRATKAKSVPRNAALPASAQPKLSNQTKVLYPKTGFTKGGLVEYYRHIAPVMLPHLAGRAVTLKRFPDGVDGKSFFEKRCAAHRPDWVRTVRVPGETERGKTIDFCLIEDVNSLIWAANLAAIELHVPLALAAEPDHPTAMVFDLDPGEPATQVDCIPIALRLKALLDQLGLQSMIKTSGGKGLHILIPLDPRTTTFDQTKSFAKAVAMTLERDDPAHVLASMSRAARRGKIFIDWSQNDRNKTTVCTYSVRAREQPSVSWPIAWDDLKEGQPLPVHLAGDKLDLKAADRLRKVMQRPQKLPAMSEPRST